MSIKKVTAINPPHKFEEYMHEIAPLSAEDGGGFIITFPDLPGCMSDGDTIEEALLNGRDAFSAWVSAAVDAKRHVPDPAARPAELVEASGRFVTRLPKSLHARLSTRAKQEGVSLNSLAIAFIAEGLGHRESCGH
jgi:antitoxin HicB